MFNLLLALACFLPIPETWISQTISVGGTTIAQSITDSIMGITVAVPGGLTDASDSGGTGSLSQGQDMSTTIQDPAHPSEPIVITTHRGATEEFSHFWHRHRSACNEVREELAKENSSTTNV